MGGLLLLAPGVFAQAYFDECASATGNNATVVLEESVLVLLDGSPLQPGDEIAIFTPDGICAGSLEWVQGVNQAITVWADDPISEEVDGFVHGEEMYYRVWSEEFNVEVGGSLGAVSVGYDACDLRPPLCSSTGDYQSGAIFYVNMLQAYMAATDATPWPVSERYISAYPNPFRNHATFVVRIPTSDRVTVELIDGLGRVVRQLYSGWMNARETYDFALETEVLSPGVYFIHVRGAGFSDTLTLTHIG